MALQITYATMSADDPELHAAYERGVETARSELGREHPFYVNGEARWTQRKHEERSPIDREIVIGRYSQGSRADVEDAIAAAKAFAPEWEATPWQERVALIRRTGDVIDDRIFTLAALTAFEVGKNRLEALGDVAETSEFCRYYARQMEEHEGYVTPLGSLGPNEENVSVLRPHGVWAVISPFNFPMALAGGPSIGALITGNTVILKPSNSGALMGLKLYEAFREAGIPAAAFQVLTGAGREIGDAIVHHPGVGGITFTGSYEVGMGIYRNFGAGMPKPAVCEMGGKNPTIVTRTADLDLASDGVLRAAFGFSGQKCSACSRVYVERPVFDSFVDLLVEKTSKLKVGDPLEKDVYMGPVIDHKAVERFQKAVAEVKGSGGEILTGGEVIETGELGRGNFVRPTVATAPEETWVWHQELFMPFLVVAPVDSLDEAIRKANDTEYGLTAGLFAGSDEEIDTFFKRIEAGVTYVNRRAGATTGAWPDVQAFGGWKASGTSGTGGGGPWYLRQYMREQSRTRITPLASKSRAER
jgi:1-pyrroline-5-carboxylate dehydrogenase